MADPQLDNKTDASEGSYRILRIPASQLPAEYHNFFFSKFLRTQKFQNPLFKLCDSQSFFENYPKYINILLSRPEAMLHFAVLPNSDVIIGFALTEPGVLHYVYVTPETRGQGIAKSLCNKPFEVVTHMTNIGLTIFSKLKGVRLDPWR